MTSFVPGVSYRNPRTWGPFSFWFAPHNISEKAYKKEYRYYRLILYDWIYIIKTYLY